MLRLLSRLPLLSHVAPPLDGAVARLTGGRQTLTTLLTGLPTVRLTTTGARSGQPRRAFLVGLPHGAGVALVASNWGKPRHPAWLYNLRANPQALLAMRGRPPQPYLARELHGAEREALWRQAVALYPGYARYERKAAPRQIAIFLLSPVAEVR